jgi:cyclopropane fatty-acyl-phospholipid synthase-like methyltransferase
MENKIIADERFTPRDFNIPFSATIRHYERYFHSIRMLDSLGIKERWLDVACGSGYGTNFLTNFSSFVVGYDIDKQAIEYACNNYKNSYCEFINDFHALTGSFFDVVFSIETIEHMTSSSAKLFLSRLNSILLENGSLIITTPILEKTNTSPINKFHHIEYSDNDFVMLLNDFGFVVNDKKFIRTKFTDGEVKDQGYYRCKKQK